MKKLLVAAVGFLLLVGPVRGAGSDPWGSTGDRKLDSTLEQINREATTNPVGFIEQLSSRFNIREEDIRRAKETYGLGAADIFMSTALAKATHRPVLAVAEEYESSQGQGWGVVAKDMGIKPGSRAFHELKKTARVSLNDMKSVAEADLKHEREMKKAHEQRIKKDYEQSMKQESKAKNKGKSR